MDKTLRFCSMIKTLEYLLDRYRLRKLIEHIIFLLLIVISLKLPTPGVSPCASSLPPGKMLVVTTQSDDPPTFRAKTLLVPQVTTLACIL